MKDKVIIKIVYWKHVGEHTIVILQESNFPKT